MPVTLAASTISPGSFTPRASDSLITASKFKRGPNSSSPPPSLSPSPPPPPQPASPSPPPPPPKEVWSCVICGNGRRGSGGTQWILKARTWRREWRRMMGDERGSWGELNWGSDHLAALLLEMVKVGMLVWRRVM
ncbi:hypothetical protein V8G54_026176 [Vigna mungo]|uniref:Uncharacterized protein n=1 Tax=Vigna mungo TaxID=3915 RepID=A0AAQ3RMZ3_VIGMU